jgi:hypothetical protein
MTTTKKFLHLVLATLLLLGTTAFAQRNTMNYSIDSKDAKHVKALISVSGGILELEPAKEKGPNVTFDYQTEYWDPSYSYVEEGDMGKLKVKARYVMDDFEIEDTDENRCSLYLDPKVSYQLGLELGVGKADVNLEGYDIDKALFRLGIGDFNINLSNTSIPLLKIQAGIGEAKIDLSGEWNNDLNAQLKAGIGEVTFYVPENVGVSFSIKGFLGDVDAHGMHKKGHVWVNDAYGETEHTLHFYVTGAIGNVVIKQK